MKMLKKKCKCVYMVSIKKLKLWFELSLFIMLVRRTFIDWTLTLIQIYSFIIVKKEIIYTVNLKTLIV